MIYYQLLHANTLYNKTIGIYTNIDNLFTDAQAHIAPEHEFQVYEMNVGDTGSTPDKSYTFCWNKCALCKKNDHRGQYEIAYVAKSYGDAVTKFIKLNAQIKELKATIDDKHRMVKSLMNLDAKNTKAPISMSVLLSSFILIDYANSKPVDSETYFKNKQAELEKMRYLNALLDDWITDLKAQTGYDGPDSELVSTDKWGSKVPAISFP